MFQHSFDLNIYSLLKYIRKVEEKTDYRLRNNSTLKKLATIGRMPNVFSRHCFMGYAMQKVFEESATYYDTWYFKDGRRDVNWQMHPDESGFQITTWENQYKLFMNYMAVYVIPVYEWCFTCMLMETIEKKYADSTYDEQLLLALQKLTAYMKENWYEILQPIENEEKTENLYSIALRHENWDELYNLRPEVVKEVIKLLIVPENDIDLNLKKLNPSDSE